jgi:hypothetical protein
MIQNCDQNMKFFYFIKPKSKTFSASLKTNNIQLPTKFPNFQASNVATD